MFPGGKAMAYPFFLPLSLIRKLNREHPIGVVAVFIAALTALSALATVAQATGAGEGRASESQGAGASERHPASLPKGNGSAGQLSSGPLMFLPAVDYDSGGFQASSAALADMNGDGKPDLLVTNHNSDSVGVLLGNGG